MVDASNPYLDWKGWRSQEFGVPSDHERAYFEREVGPLLSNRASVLEIGFGNGSLLGFLRDRNHDVTGIEADSELVRRATEAGFRVVGGLESLPAESFDFVVALDVLEHIPNEQSAGFLTAIARTLKPRGRVLLRFPNGDSPFGRVNQHGDPTHVNTIGSMKLRFLAAEASLRVTVFKSPASPQIERGVKGWLKRMRNRLVFYVFERIVAPAYFGSRLPMSVNLVAILAK